MKFQALAKLLEKTTANTAKQKSIKLNINPIKGNKLGQYKLKEDEQFSPVKEVPFEELHGGQGYVNGKIVQEYKKKIQAGEPIDPITVKQMGGNLDVIDGYHRADALYELGFKTLPVTFVEDNEIIAKMEWSKSYPGVPFDPYNDFNEISKSFPDWKNIIKK